MTMAHFLAWAHDTWIGEAARRLPWIYTTGLVLHFIGLSLLMGAMLIVDLRILGFPKQMPFNAALKFLPVAIAGFILNALTGAVFFCFDPVGMWGNPAFRIKMALVLLAGLNALFFTVAEHRKLLSLAPDSKATWPMRASAALSIVGWFAVMVFGRLIVAFQGSTDLFK